MVEQRTFASLAYSQKGKVTRREQFLAEMEAVIPWRRLLAVIEPYYPKGGPGRQPLGLEKMLRIYFLQQWFNLSDPQAEDAIYDSESMRRFAKVELADDTVPDESTILRFRHLLEEHGLTRGIFDEINGLLEEKRLLLRSGTIVDATIIAAPHSLPEARNDRGSGAQFPSQTTVGQLQRWGQSCGSSMTSHPSGQWGASGHDIEEQNPMHGAARVHGCKSPPRHARSGAQSSFTVHALDGSQMGKQSPGTIEAKFSEFPPSHGHATQPKSQ
jgi:IS5 family transposase